MLQIPANFSFQLTNLLFLIPPILKAITDSNLQITQHRSVKHKKSILGFILIGIVLAYIDFRVSPVEYYFQSVLLGIAYFFLIFDYLRNYLVHKPVLYIDDDPNSDPDEDSWIDVNVYSRLGPIPLLGFKLLFFILAFTVYYYYNYI